MSGMIEVDGILRLMLNINGQLIHSTEEGTRNFWRWFGDSKVASKCGTPLLVYHGTEQRNLNEFKKGIASKRYLMLTEFNVETQGNFFSENIEDAAGYGSNVVDVYLSINNPMMPLDEIIFSSKEQEKSSGIFNDYEYILEPVIEIQDGKRVVDLMGEQYFEVTDEMIADGSWVNEIAEGGIHWSVFDNQEVAKRMIERGYDGAKVYEPNDISGHSWFVAESNKIKSATGNSGDFNPASSFIYDTERPVDCPSVNDEVEYLFDDDESEILLNNIF